MTETRPSDSVSPRTQFRNYGDGRIALLDAAVRVVAQGGLRNLTYRNVAAEAGVAHGLVRHYFGNRDALVKAALEHVIQESLAESGLEREISSENEIAEGLVQSVEADPGKQVFQYELILQSIRQPEMQPAVRELHVAYRSAMAQQLTQLGLGNDQDLANLVFAALDGLVFEQVALGKPDVTERAILKLREILSAYKAKLAQ